jgi:hypothetical protein
MVSTVATAETREQLDYPAPAVVVGVIDDYHQVQNVLNELDSEGFPRHLVTILQGESGSEKITRRGGKGLRSQFKRVMEEYVGGAKDLIERHKDEARLGHYVIAVSLPTLHVENRYKVCRILTAHSGHAIVSRSNSTFATLAY